MKSSALLLALLIPFAAGAAEPAPAAAAHPVTTAPPAARVAVRSLTENQKIEALIAGVEHLPGAVFIRNGSEFDGERAAAHMRLKWHNAGRRVKTAEQFIDYCASASSLSGKKYRIRFADGRTVDSGDYFHQQLKLLEARPAGGVARAR
jgi:hypothetical protein